MIILFLLLISGCLINADEEYDQLLRRKKVQGQHRIVGGHEANEGDHPWQVFVYNEDIGTRCGGTVISADYVLSAAHCFSNLTTPRKKSSFKFMIGSNDLREYRKYSRLASNIVIHDLYNKDSTKNDIALVKLKKSLDLSKKYYKALDLPDPGDIFYGINCTVTGWGRTIENDKRSLSYVINEVDVPVLPDRRCYRSDIGHTYKASTMLCAGYLEEGGKAPCMGDSGGPLTCKLDDGSRKLAGIVSWGIGCARPNKPGVFTRVSAFVDWIRANMR